MIVNINTLPFSFYVYIGSLLLAGKSRSVILLAAASLNDAIYHIYTF